MQVSSKLLKHIHIRLYILVQVSDGRQALSIPHTKDRKGQQDSSESASDNQDLMLFQNA